MKPARAALGPALRRAAALSIAAGALMLLRLLERGFALSPRAALIVALAAGGALVGGWVGYLLLSIFAGRAPRALRALIGSLLAGGGALFGFYVLFAMVRSFGELELHGEELAEESTLHLVLGLLLDAAGFVATIGAPFFVPWTAPAIVVCAGALALWSAGRDRAR